MLLLPKTRSLLIELVVDDGMHNDYQRGGPCIRKSSVDKDDNANKRERRLIDMMTRMTKLTEAFREVGQGESVLPSPGSLLDSRKRAKSSSSPTSTFELPLSAQPRLTEPPRNLNNTLKKQKDWRQWELNPRPFTFSRPRKGHAKRKSYP
jgi:hypothetical protein